MNLSHFISEKVMFVVCEKWVETRTDCYIDPSSSSTIAALRSHPGLGCSTRGPWEPKALCLQLVLTSTSCLQLTRTAQAPGSIIFYRPPVSVVLPLIYTGESLDWRLGRGSIYNRNPTKISAKEGPNEDHIENLSISLYIVLSKQNSTYIVANLLTQ